MNSFSIEKGRNQCLTSPRNVRKYDRNYLYMPAHTKAAGDETGLSLCVGPSHARSSLQTDYSNSANISSTTIVPPADTVANKGPCPH